MEKNRAVYRVLTINPGSTSTKIGVFDDTDCVFEQVIRHSYEMLQALLPENGDFKGQKEMRRKLILQALSDNAIEPASIDAIAGRGGRMPPMQSGAYLLNDAILHDLPHPLPHPAPLGSILARELGDAWGVPAYTVDPTSVDEFIDLARLTGIKEIQRQANFHALNQKMCARRYAQQAGKSYEDICLVVAHMGGGISIGAHCHGRVVDATHPNSGEGPFTPERSGSIPGVALVELCYSGSYTKQQLRALLSQKGGAVSHLGTSDMREVERRWAEGEPAATQVFEGMAYSVAKYIGMMVAALGYRPEAIVLTGGLAHSKAFCNLIESRVGHMADCFVLYPGEDELRAMAEGVLRVLKGEEAALEYTTPDILCSYR